MVHIGDAALCERVFNEIKKGASSLLSSSHQPPSDKVQKKKGMQQNTTSLLFQIGNAHTTLQLKWIREVESKRVLATPSEPAH